MSKRAIFSGGWRPRGGSKNGAATGPGTPPSQGSSADRPARGNKYHARKTGCAHGHTHDSAKEARRCNDLHLLQRAGQISRLEVQPQFWFHVDGVAMRHENGRRIGWRPDFQYFEGDRNVVEDVKGGKATRTEAYTLRLAIFRALYPFIVVREV